MSNKRGEVYESWVNSFGFGFVIFLIIVGLFIAAMAGWL
ncbi:hypothetical protein [Bacteriophage Eos]|nr:hypothetical protein [Bacteriophage Eos]